MTLTISKCKLSKQQHTITLNYTLGENEKNSLIFTLMICRNFFAHRNVGCKTRDGLAHLTKEIQIKLVWGHFDLKVILSYNLHGEQLSCMSDRKIPAVCVCVCVCVCVWGRVLVLALNAENSFLNPLNFKLFLLGEGKGCVPNSSRSVISSVIFFPFFFSFFFIDTYFVTYSF